jgi:hypothetical protein
MIHKNIPGPFYVRIFQCFENGKCGGPGFASWVFTIMEPGTSFSQTVAPGGTVSSSHSTLAATPSSFFSASPPAITTPLVSNGSTRNITFPVETPVQPSDLRTTSPAASAPATAQKEIMPLALGIGLGLGIPLLLVLGLLAGLKLFSLHKHHQGQHGIPSPLQSTAMGNSVAQYSDFPEVVPTAELPAQEKAQELSSTQIP